MAVLQGEFCAVNIEIAKPNGRYIEVAVLQRARVEHVMLLTVEDTTLYTGKNYYGTPCVSRSYSLVLVRLDS